MLCLNSLCAAANWWAIAKDVSATTSAVRSSCLRSATSCCACSAATAVFAVIDLTRALAVYFSLAGDTLLVKEPVSKWYILKSKVNAPSPDEAPPIVDNNNSSITHMFRRGSQRNLKTVSTTLSPWALLCTVSFRDTRDQREKMVRQISHEMACRLPPSLRRKIILERPISQVHEDVIKSIYNIGGVSQGRVSPTASPLGISFGGSSGSSASFPQLTRSQTANGMLSSGNNPPSSQSPPPQQPLDAPEPVYIEFEDLHDDDDDRDDSSDDAIVLVDDADGTVVTTAKQQMDRPPNPFSEFLEKLEMFSVVCEEGSRTRTSTSVFLSSAYDTRNIHKHTLSTTGSSAIQLATDLTMIGNDFMARAERIGRVIIEELFLPERQQTLKPIRDRGQLGGFKVV